MDRMPFELSDLEFRQYMAFRRQKRRELFIIVFGVVMVGTMGYMVFANREAGILVLIINALVTLATTVLSAPVTINGSNTSVPN
jgi:hypothetical protein